MQSTASLIQLKNEVSSRSLQVINASHPVSRDGHTILQAIGVTVIQIALGLRCVDTLEFGREDLRVTIVN